MSHAALIAIYVSGALSEILGIALTARDVTVNDPGDGTIQIEVPKRWHALRGPALIVLGILLGLWGNIGALPG